MHTHAHTHTSTHIWRDAVTKIIYQQNPLMCEFLLPIFLIHKHSTFFLFSLHSPGLIQFTMQTEQVISQVIHCKKLLWDLYLFCCEICERSGLADRATKARNSIIKANSLLSSSQDSAPMQMP